MKTIQKKPEHWPTLNTVIMVEKVIKNSKDSIITLPELKKNLPRQVNHNTLIIILQYLEESNKILFTSKGITWIHNPNPNLRKAISKSLIK
ncbi:MAG: hypothetical protein AABY22_12360 [Nanoarchaeota archaeon]